MIWLRLAPAAAQAAARLQFSLTKQASLHQWFLFCIPLGLLTLLLQQAALDWRKQPLDLAVEDADKAERALPTFSLLLPAPP